MFFTKSFFTTSIDFFKSKETDFNLPTSKSSTFTFKLLKLGETSTSLLMSNLSISGFNAMTSFLVAKLDVPTPVEWSTSSLVVFFF